MPFDINRYVLNIFKYFIVIKFYHLNYMEILYYNNRNKVYPINNSKDHYITIHKLDYKPSLKINELNKFKK